MSLYDHTDKIIDDMVERIHVLQLDGDRGGHNMGYEAAIKVVCTAVLSAKIDELKEVIDTKAI